MVGGLGGTSTLDSRQREIRCRCSLSLSLSVATCGSHRAAVAEDLLWPGGCLSLHTLSIQVSQSTTVRAIHWSEVYKSHSPSVSPNPKLGLSTAWFCSHLKFVEELAKIWSGLIHSVAQENSHTNRPEDQCPNTETLAPFPRWANCRAAGPHSRLMDREEGGCLGKNSSGLAWTKPQDDWGGCWGLVADLSHLAHPGGWNSSPAKWPDTGTGLVLLVAICLDSCTGPVLWVAICLVIWIVVPVQWCGC